MAAASINTRQRLLDFIKGLSEQEVTALAHQLLPEVPGGEVDTPNGPLVFTEEESRARLIKALNEVAEGKTMSLDTFNAKVDALAKARVQG